MKKLKRYTMAVDDQKGLYHYCTAKGKWYKVSDIKDRDAAIKATSQKLPCMANKCANVNILCLKCTRNWDGDMKDYYIEEK